MKAFVQSQPQPIMLEEWCDINIVMYINSCRYIHIYLYVYVCNIYNIYSYIYILLLCNYLILPNRSNRGFTHDLFKNHTYINDMFVC